MDYNLGQFPNLTQLQMASLPILLSLTPPLCSQVLTQFTWQGTYLFVTSNTTLTDTDIGNIQAGVSNIQKYINLAQVATLAQTISDIQNLNVGINLSYMDISLAMVNIVNSSSDYATFQANFSIPGIIQQILTDRGL